MLWESLLRYCNTTRIGILIVFFNLFANKAQQYITIWCAFSPPSTLNNLTWDGSWFELWACKGIRPKSLRTRGLSSDLCKSPRRCVIFILAVSQIEIAAADSCSIIDSPPVHAFKRKRRKRSSVFTVSCREYWEGKDGRGRSRAGEERRGEKKRKEKMKKDHAVSSAWAESGEQNVSHQWTSVGKEGVNYLSGGLLGEECRDRFVPVRWWSMTHCKRFH